MKSKNDPIGNVRFGRLYHNVCWDGYHIWILRLPIDAFVVGDIMNDPVVLVSV